MSHQIFSYQDNKKKLNWKTFLQLWKWSEYIFYDIRMCSDLMKQLISFHHDYMSLFTTLIGFFQNKYFQKLSVSRLTLLSNTPFFVIQLLRYFTWTNGLINFLSSYMIGPDCKTLTKSVHHCFLSCWSQYSEKIV